VGTFTLDQAIDLGTLVAHVRGSGVPDAATTALVPLEHLLPDFPSVQLEPEGVEHVGHGRLLDASHFTRDSVDQSTATPWTRLLDPVGHLIGVASPGPVQGTLHPTVVLI
jgi:hypothetical protein